MRRTIVACVVTALVVGGGTATAQKLITSGDIKDGTIKSADIKNGTIKTEDIKKSTITRDRSGEEGAATPRREGAAGPAGPTGPGVHRVRKGPARVTPGPKLSPVTGASITGTRSALPAHSYARVTVEHRHSATGV